MAECGLPSSGSPHLPTTQPASGPEGGSVVCYCLQACWVLGKSIQRGPGAGLQLVGKSNGRGSAGT